MPGLNHLLIVAPNADQAGILTDTGFHTDTPLYLASDAVPRPQWGGWTGTAFTAAQQLQVPTWQTNYPNSRFTIYNVLTQKTVPQDTLNELGLTTSSAD